MMKEINCGNYYCMYWENDTCLLDGLDLDIQGNCMNCILIELSDEVLEQERKRTLAAWHREELLSDPAMPD